MSPPLIISHRALLEGPNPSRENRPECIKEVINLGFDCEIDVKCRNETLFLGHDAPLFKIDVDFLLENAAKLYIHCKDFFSLNYLQEFEGLNLFYHDRDEHVFTSCGHLITHQDQLRTTDLGIMVLKNKPTEKDLLHGFGIITDWPILAKKIYEENSRL